MCAWINGHGGQIHVSIPFSHLKRLPVRDRGLASHPARAKHQVHTHDQKCKGLEECFLSTTPQLCNCGPQALGSVFSTLRTGSTVSLYTKGKMEPSGWCDLGNVLQVPLYLITVLSEKKSNSPLNSAASFALL